MAPKLKRFTQWFGGGGVIALMAWLASAQQPAAPKVTADALVNAAGNGAEWLSYGHDYSGDAHFSPLNQVNTKNVRRLSVVWSLHHRTLPQAARWRRDAAHAERSSLRHPPVGRGQCSRWTRAAKARPNGAGIPDVPREHIQGLSAVDQ